MNQSFKVEPPRLAFKFLEWFCPANLYEGIEGDLIEQFEKDALAIGVKAAKKRLFWNVTKFFRPGIILRNRFSIQLINMIMLRNYLMVAFRNVVKNKVFSAINIFGLGIGLAACLLIIQFVSFELSYDTFHSKLDRTYRVTNDRFQNGKLIQHGTIMYPTIGPTMAKDYAEIETYTRLMPGGDMNIIINDKNFRDSDCHFADERFFSVFDFELLAGDRASLLKDPYTVTLTEETANRYFGASNGNYADVIGKTFLWGLDPQPYTVKGVCQNIPENSHIQFDVLVAYSTLYNGEEKDADISWTWSDMRHYLVLKPGADFKALESKFPAFSDRYFQGDKVSGSVEKFYLQPMREAHLYSDYEYDIAETASGKAVWAMLIVALFILLIAWINYINLTTSRALDRAKEVGLRKVMGAFKSQLIKQFIFESLIITFLAFAFAIILVQVFQFPFNQIVGSNLSLWKIFSFTDRSVIAMAIAVLVGGALLSGFYPAFILSSYQPVTVLKGKFQRSSQGNFLRKALVVFQFTASGALITGTIIVSNQLKYMNEADLGINLESIVIVNSPELLPYDSTFNDRVVNYEHELSQINGVVSAATSNRRVGTRLGRTFGIRLSDQPSDAHYTLSHIGVDHNFFDTYKIPVLAGRKFLPTDHKVRFRDLSAIIMNESAVKLLGIESVESAIGKEIIWGDNRKWTIVGVVGDYHQESLKKPKEAMLFRPQYSTYSDASIRIQTEDTKKVLADIEVTYKKFFPGNSFEYLFLDENYRQQYNDDNRFGQVVNIFTALAIIVSCLGLIGLSSYTAVQRTKEIGIRKVLGASLLSIVSLLSANFVRLVLVAALLSLPIAYFSMQNWLESYAYRITPGLLQFALPVLLVLSIAMLTISFQVIRAARTNPAETLKYE